MPTSPAEPCTQPGCPERAVSRGRCAVHRQDVAERARGSASRRGYGSSKGSAWQVFRRSFLAQLLEAGVMPVCGATLPNGPQTQDSRCRRDQQWSVESRDGSGLHFDHAPALTAQERAAAVAGDRRAFDDPRRIQLLCADCHRAKVEPR